MNLAQLQHLLSLADTGSFSKSAEALHLTQPALSRSIRALEEELGLPLVDRIGRRNEITPFGLTVLERARRILFEATELRESAARLQRAESGSIRVGFGSGPAAMLTGPLLRRIASLQSRPKLTIGSGPTALQLQSLRQRDLDALVVDARSVVPACDLRIEFLAEMRAGFLCRHEHPLARRGGPLSFEALEPYPVASTPLSHEVARVLMQRYGPQAHPDECVALRCENIAVLIDTVLHTEAVFLGILAAAREPMARGEMVELPVRPALDFGAQFAYVTLEGRTEAPPMRLLRELVAQSLHD